MTHHEREELIEAMALDMANQNRREKGLRKAEALTEIDNAPAFRHLAQAGLDAYLRVRLGH